MCLPGRFPLLLLPSLALSTTAVPLSCLAVPARFLSAIKCSITLSNRVAHVRCYSCCCTSGHCSTCQSQHHSRTAAGDESWCEAPFSPATLSPLITIIPGTPAGEKTTTSTWNWIYFAHLITTWGNQFPGPFAHGLRCHVVRLAQLLEGGAGASQEASVCFLAYHLNWCSLHIHRFHPQSAITFHFIYSSSSTSSSSILVDAVVLKGIYLRCVFSSCSFPKKHIIYFLSR